MELPVDDEGGSARGLGTGIDQQGLIEAAEVRLEAADGNAYELAVNQSGLIRASGVERKEGRVLLTAAGGALAHDGRIEARDANGAGGEVLIGGDYRGGNPQVANAGEVRIAAGGVTDNLARYYGDATEGFDVIVGASGLAPHHQLSDLVAGVVAEGALFYPLGEETDPVADRVIDAGSYLTRVRLSDNPDLLNYIPLENPGLFTVLPRPVTMTMGDTEVYAGQPIPEVDFILDGLADFDNRDNAFPDLIYRISASANVQPRVGAEVTPADVDFGVFNNEDFLARYPDYTITAAETAPRTLDGGAEGPEPPTEATLPDGWTELMVEDVRTIQIPQSEDRAPQVIRVLHIGTLAGLNGGDPAPTGRGHRRLRKWRNPRRRHGVCRDGHGTELCLWAPVAADPAHRAPQHAAKGGDLRRRGAGSADSPALLLHLRRQPGLYRRGAGSRLD